MTDAILKEAERLLDGEAQEGLTLQRLASALGYATTAIYRYFESKEALVVALQRRAIAGLQTEIDKALASQKDPLRALAAAAMVFAGWPERAPGHFRLVSLSLADSRVMIDDLLAAPVAMDVAALLARVDEAAARALPSPQHFASTMWATLHGLLSMKKLARLPALAHLGERATIEAAVVRLLIGYGADPKAAKKALP